MALFYGLSTEPAPLAAESAYHALIEISGKLLHEIQDFIFRYGLSQARFRTLLLVNRAGKEGCKPSYIAEKMMVERASVTELLGSLERDGLITRRRGEGDRRSVTVAVTPAGSRLVRRMLPERVKYLLELMAPLSERECIELVRLLDKLGRNGKDGRDI